MTTREQLEAEAEESYRYPSCEGYTVLMSTALVWLKQGWVQAKTISAEQWEAAAEGAYYATGTPLTWETSSKPQRQTYRSIARAAFRAAGFYVEDTSD